jgi:hypothetical protein
MNYWLLLIYLISSFPLPLSFIPVNNVPCALLFTVRTWPQPTILNEETQSCFPSPPLQLRALPAFVRLKSMTRLNISLTPFPLCLAFLSSDFHLSRSSIPIRHIRHRESGPLRPPADVSNTCPSAIEHMARTRMRHGFLHVV